MNTRLALVLAGLGLLLPISLTAQQPLPLTPGQRVRVVIPGPGGRPARHVTGNLLRQGADTLVLVTGGGLVRPETLAVALAPDRRLEVVAGTRSRWREGAGVGCALGLVAGAAIGAGQRRSPGPWNVGPDIDPQILLAGIAGGAGCLVGWAVGSSIRTETWAPLEKAGVRLGLAPLPAGRLALGAAISF